MGINCKGVWFTEIFGGLQYLYCMNCPCGTDCERDM